MDGVLGIDFWKYVNTALLLLSVPLSFWVYRISLKRNAEICISVDLLPSYLRRVVAYCIDWVICLNIAWGIVKVLSVTNFIHWALAFPVLLIVILFLYFILLESSPVKGTLGKLSMGIEIVNRDGTGQTIGKSCIRLLLNILLGVCFPITNMTIFFTKYRQCAFEVLSNTLVVKKH